MSPTFKPSPDPKGCVAVDEHERCLTAIADEMESKARELISSNGDRISTATAKEMYLGAIRARKCAAELAKHRLDIDHDRWLVDEQRKLTGTPIVRPPLKRKTP